MSKLPSTRPVVPVTQSKEISSLQNKLLQSLNSVYDPKSNAVKSDDYFLQDDHLEPVDNKEDDTLEEYKNPYAELAEKAKAYVRQKEAELPARPKVPVTTSTTKPVNKKGDKGDTFLTGIGLEKTEPPPVVKKENKSDDEDDYELPELNYREALEDANTATGGYDDLEELRRMIKQTRKEMKEYGKELIDLKNVISEVNEYAGKELGYSANYEHFRTMDNTLQDLKQHHEFKYLKKNNSSMKNMKGPLPVSGNTSNASGGLKAPSSKELGTKTYMKSSTADSLPTRTVKPSIGSGSTAVRSFGLQKK